MREALAVMDEREDAFMPGVGVKVASEKSIWEIARQVGPQHACTSPTPQPSPS